jgi:hypothetical protein
MVSEMGKWAKSSFSSRQISSWTSLPGSRIARRKREENAGGAAPPDRRRIIEDVTAGR